MEQLPSKLSKKLNLKKIFQKLSKKLNLKKIFQRSTQNMTTQNMDPAPNSGINHSSEYFTSYAFGQLQRATRNFATDSIIGQGEFGNVYVVDKESTKPIAVKDMRSNRHEYLAEIGALSAIIHPNIIRLFGYCSEGDRRLIVYEYTMRGSLYSYMHEHDPTKGPLDWITRMKIALGIARALEYLHQLCDQRVIFRDVKSRNVILEEDFNPKLADFGLCTTDELPPQYKGGFAPEYAATNKVDVYAFGVIMLELATGRKAVDQNVLLVDWAQNKLRDGYGFDSISDERLNGVYPRERFEKFVRMALRCTKKAPGDRPQMYMLVLFIENLDNRIENAPAIDMELPITWIQVGNCGRKDRGAHRREASI